MTLNGFISNSFDRFGDDLCELLLSYLPISDKINFECVSKQWNRLIFNKLQNITIINKLYVNHQISSESYDSIKISYKIWNVKSKSIIECLTKKFQFINKLTIDFRIDNDLVKIIVENCKVLKKFQTFGSPNENFWVTFGKKFGPKLEFIDIHAIEKSRILSILGSTPNLKAIKIHDNYEALIEQYLPKLEKIIIREHSIEWLVKFANLYGKQIKSAHFDFYWQELLSSSISVFSRFVNLESLKLEAHYCRCDETFVKMAKNLKNLKRITISFAYIDESFNALKVFNKIEFFEIILTTFKNEDIKIIETLDLTKLHLSFCYSNLSHESYVILSKMRRMTEIRLNIFNSKNMNDSGICYLIKNNAKLQTIELIDRHINETTINAIIEKALNNPKKHFKFRVKYLKNKLITEKLIPKNLLLQLCKYL
jgi:hypothetical protein